jgi:anti-sigma factor RsiW
MNALLSLSLMHRQVTRMLPWYVKGQLRAEEVRRVETHLAGCRTCRTEAEGLSKLFDAHTARLDADHPVDDSKLEALFSRIDQYEAKRRQASVEAATADARSKHDGDSTAKRSWLSLGDWLTPKPLLVAGSLAVLVLAVVVVPTLQSPVTAPVQRTLSTDAPVSALRIKLQFQNAPDAKTVEQLVKSSVPGGKASIERRSPTEYVVVFQEKPGMDTLSRLIDSWRATPNVADVAIDGAGS